MIKISIELRWRDVFLFLLLAAVITGSVLFIRNKYANTDFEITDDLGGNVFPSAILSTATTDQAITIPIDTPFVGNSKLGIAVRIRSRSNNTRVRIEIAPTPFFNRSVSEFILPRGHTDYVIYPDIVWNYEALKKNKQVEPVSMVVQVNESGVDLGEKMHTLSIRGINECLLGYNYNVGKRTAFRSTGFCFAAYVNEEHPMIDKLLREALDHGIVNRFLGYQGDSAAVCRQVYALWDVLHRRKFQYSSVSNSSLSSNLVYSQRVRTFGDAVSASQINCVDGSVLMASLLRAINIDPVLLRSPGHMYVGFYTDGKHKHLQCIETTMIGDGQLNEFFPNEKLDSVVAAATRRQASLITFNKATEYANRNYLRNAANFKRNSPGFMFLEISRALRRRVQPIGM